MYAKDDAGTTFADDVAEIIRRLTAIARRSDPTSNGEEQLHDFGEVISIAVTAVAANFGSKESLLTGRPGSWEAGYVNRIIDSTVGAGELHRFRTEPLRMLLDPESVFEDAGLKELFDEEDRELCGEYLNGGELGTNNNNNDATVDARRSALHAAYSTALDAYFEAYSNSVRLAAAEKDISASVSLKRVADYRTESSGDSLADSLHAIARDRTRLPVTIVSERC